jgi:hypothetical protein
VRVTPQGWEYEPDQRHADIIIDTMNLGCAKDLTTPYEDEKDRDQETGDEELPTQNQTQFRMLAARANYLAMDRPDIQYAIKEICRGMATPRKRHWRMLKRLARYLKGKPRTVFEYKWQKDSGEIEGYTDSDWAGCKQTSKSTS